ncbi:aminoglycoside phosphotransferase family protein [Roseitranquillus sediminis]|uniref:aminoglycoside phosphotransferase family protein n=1 Tax=Roseitranquillus sediminis TaxID=2809051 RepID=UPI001D0CB123|nr:phosphotransferase [Roseitranquillus sediminis]MBM9596255.1 phosphotransferase [Roseitranquillus sediminis]
MTDRTERMTAFLDRAGWGAAVRTALAGDASNRHYLRLSGPHQAVLMDAPPERGESVAPFIRVARHLTSIGLSAPEIIAADPENGFLLLEDLGDDLFARVIARDRGAEKQLYSAAVDVLAHLHAHPPPEDPRYGPEEMAAAARLAWTWYRNGAIGDAEGEDAFHQEIRALLRLHVPDTSVLVLRDFHAENLIWLPQRVGVARVGLLDFQDAAAGHPIYDLVSLVADVRRDVSLSVHRAMLARYSESCGMERAHVDLAAALLGVQRNLRILGTFARLCLRDGKPRYLDLLPRVWNLLQADLDHPALTSLARRVRRDLPPPDSPVLDRLRSACLTAPTR